MFFIGVESTNQIMFHIFSAMGDVLDRLSFATHPFVCMGRPHMMLLTGLAIKGTKVDQPICGYSAQHFFTQNLATDEQARVPVAAAVPMLSSTSPRCFQFFRSRGGSRREQRAARFAAPIRGILQVGAMDMMRSDGLNCVNFEESSTAETWGRSGGSSCRVVILVDRASRIFNFDVRLKIGSNHPPSLNCKHGLPMSISFQPWTLSHGPLPNRDRITLQLKELTTWANCRAKLMNGLPSVNQTWLFHITHLQITLHFYEPLWTSIEFLEFPS